MTNLSTLIFATLSSKLLDFLSLLSFGSFVVSSLLCCDHVLFGEGKFKGTRLTPFSGEETGERLRLGDLDFLNLLGDLDLCLEE